MGVFKKRTALFETHNREKPIFFSKLVRVFARSYANTVLIGYVGQLLTRVDNTMIRSFSFLDLLWARAHPWSRFKSHVHASFLSDGHIG